MNMGIYIKNMTLEEFSEYGEDIQSLIGQGQVEEIPPHGRLIDVDVLEQNAQKRLLMCNKNNNQFQKPYEVMRAIALAPTVISAEPKKENE